VLAITISVAFVAAPALALASTYSVLGTADSTAPCLGTSCPSLRAAVLAADGDPGSTIKLGPVAYVLGNGSGMPVGTGELRVTADVTIAGAGSGATTISQTDGENRVISVSAGTVMMSGLRLTGGSVVGTAGFNGAAGATVVGGGVDNAGSLTLQDVVVSGNGATGGDGGGSVSVSGGIGGNALGGGIATSGALTMVASSVSGNAATGGSGGGSSAAAGGPGGNAFAGVYIDPLSTGAAILRASTVSNNIATGGAGGQSSARSHPGAGGDATGGISQWSQALTLFDSSVSGNTATGGIGGTSNNPGAHGAEGGGAAAAGIALIGGRLQLDRATVSGNRAQGGAGGAADATTGGQGGSVSGGGLLLQSDATLVNTTITGNGATGGAPGLPFGGGGSTGPPGGAFGGGIYDGGGSSQTVTLASVTLASNAASDGGNLWAGATGLAVGDAIISSGGASAKPNCDVAAITDSGRNLESTTPSQCGFSAAAHDVIGADPLLGALAANGGSTLTMALAATSPARGTGGQCVDPTSASQPLSIDERGLPRGNLCDIGPFQTESPANTGLPHLGGTAVLGKTITCSQGSWSGDPPLSFAVQWLRTGVAIPGATGSTYSVAAVDVGRQLSCRVTASNIYGQTTAASSPVTALATKRPSRFGGSTLASTRLPIDPHGNVILKVRCPANANGGRCVNAVALYTRSGKLPATVSAVARRPPEARLLGTAHFSVRAGKTLTTRLHLNAAGAKLAGAHASFRARSILTSHDLSRRSSTRRYTVTLKRAPPHRRKRR
jgi:hypothetical protein